MGSDEGGAGGGGQDQAVRVREHGCEGGVICRGHLALEGQGFAEDVVVEDCHSQSTGALRDCEADVAEADDAEGVVPWVVGYEGDGDMGFVEGGGGGGACGEGGGGRVREDADEVVEGCVGDGFGGGAQAVAVEDS